MVRGYIGLEKAKSSSSLRSFRHKNFRSPLIGWVTEFFGPRQAVASGGVLTILESAVDYYRFRGQLEAPEDLSIGATLGK